MIGVSLSTLKRLVRNREISFYQPTERKKLFSDEHITTFLRRREVTSPADRKAGAGRGARGTKR
jgi:hypothetical protein